jgi:hypothetical protein
MDENPGNSRDAVLDGMPEFQNINAEAHEGLAGGSGPFLEKGGYNMLWKQLIRIKTAGFFLGVIGKDALYSLC